MNARSWFLVTLVGANLAGTGSGQQRAGGSAEFELPYTVRVPRIEPDRFEYVLQWVICAPEVAAAFVAAFPAEAKVTREGTDLGWNMNVVASGRHAIVKLIWTVAGGQGLDLPADAVAVVARAVTKKLDALLYQPQLEDLTKRMNAVGKQAQEAEAAWAALAGQLQGLGFDDLAATQQALAGLMQKSLEAEVDLRTEQAMQKVLQEQIAHQEAGLREHEQRFAVLQGQLQSAEANLAEAKANPGAERTSEFAARVHDAEQKLADLRAKRNERTTQADRQRELVGQLQTQLTQSLLALQRSTSRKDVLDQMVAVQRDQLAKAAAMARERERLQREADRLRQAADEAHARARALRAERDALETVRVEPWK
jgi:hypothetical protein